MFFLLTAKSVGAKYVLAEFWCSGPPTESRTGGILMPLSPVSGMALSVSSRQTELGPEWSPSGKWQETMPCEEVLKEQGCLGRKIIIPKS